MERFKAALILISVVAVMVCTIFLLHTKATRNSNFDGLAEMIARGVE